MANIKTIQIAFNMEDPLQEKLYNFYKSQGKNASFFGKMLIQREMEKVGFKQDPGQLVDQPIKKSPVEQYFEEIKINSGGIKLMGGK